MNTHPSSAVPSGFRRSGPLVALALTLATAPLQAITFEQGLLSGSFDSTFSLGGLYRLDDPDRRFYGVSNGGLANSVNTDDGNLNYRKGWASQVFKGTHDLEVQYGENFGLFTRVTYFYDWQNADSERARKPLTEQARERVAQRIEYLDLYGLYRFEVGSRPVDLRIGRQVLSLGESTFIPNGLNVVNPVDVSKLRVPGAELREAFLPVNMVKASIGLTDQTTLEAFWLLEFRRTEIEPAGTYFSTNDFASRGGSQVYLGFGALSDRNALGAIPRAPDRTGGDLNQYGFALRTLAAGLNDTEFGLYFAKYHSRVPLISARTPTGPINTNLTGPLTAVFISAGLPAVNAAAQADAVWGLIVLSQTNPGALTPVQLATLQAASTQAAIAGARQIALLTAAASGRYFTEFPEGTNMIGASFNTDLSRFGVAWQGEVSYKMDTPLQVDDVEVLFAALSALNPAFGANNQIGNYLGQYAREIPGFRRLDVWTAQNTLTKVFGPMLGASQLTLVGEAGGVWVPDLPSKDLLRFEGAATYTSGNPAAMVGTGSALPGTSLDAFADDFSWGYQVVARLDYTNLFAGLNLTPTIAYTHDVSGNTPSPLANFIEGRKSINVSAELTWQNAWSMEIRYVDFFGAGRHNLLADRDYFATTLKYSF
jgi:hypothetical protein